LDRQAAVDTPVRCFSVIHDGRIVADQLISRTTFRNITRAMARAT
jgi:hypothetical protein